MSETDSFIEEVTEEVRRDRVFAAIKRYGWIAVALVIVLVGGAAWNEWNKAQDRSAAQATGDALIAGVAASDDASRVAALSEIVTPSANAQIVSDFLLSAHQIAVDDKAGAAETLNGVAVSATQMPDIYRQIAAFKAVLAQGSDMVIAERRTALEAMAAPGMPLALLAQEQLVLVDIEEGKTEAAIAGLNAIIADANVTAGLRRRASQLIVALGGAPVAAIGAAEDQ